MVADRAPQTQCDPWLLAIPEMVSMRTFLFYFFFFGKNVEQFWFRPHVEREKF